MKYYLILLSIIFVGCSMFQKSNESIFESKIEIEDSMDELLSPEEIEGLVEDADIDDTDDPATMVTRSSMGGYFSVTYMNCNVRKKPTIKSNKLHIIRKGKRLWVEIHPEYREWFTVYTRRSLAYMSRSCFIEEL